ncbi:cation-translocating P-type ATPase [Ktedonobacteria bacterium brp13]|nr:cation-translocating P-type ATPase [Ktedonobacteria bacterium brp13]
MTIAAEEIEVGTEIVVKPGELVPVDGVVTSGSSSMSEADLTGEPVPVRKMAGMFVLSGSVNLDGVVEIRASKRSAESQYAQIVHLGRRVMRVAVQGIWVGIGLSGIAMLFAAFGFIAPAAGALLQEGIDVLVILNALRVGRITF